MTKTEKIKSDFSKIFWILKETEINKKALIWGFFLAGVFVILNFFMLSLLFPIVNIILNKDLAVIDQLKYLSPIIEYLNIGNSFWKVLLFMGIFLYTTTLLKSIIKYLTFLSINLQTQTASKKIRDLVFRRYLSFGKLFFDNSKSADLNRIIMDSSTTINRILDSINKIIIETITIFVYLLFLFYISWKLTLLSLLPLILFYFISSAIKEKIKELSKERENIQKTFSNKISEIISCIVLVRGFGKEEQEESKFKIESEKEINSNIKIQKKLQTIPPLEELLSNTTILIIAGAIAIVSVYDSSLAMANALVFIYILMRIPGEINSIQGAQINLAQVQGKLEDLEEILDDKEKYIFEGGDREFKGLNHGIVIKNLDFGYDQNLVLKNLNLEIRKGEKVAIIGKTGSGKTTLANLLLRFYDCEPQKIFLDGCDIREYDLKSLKQHFAFVTQNAILFNDTIRANILYANEKIAQERFESIFNKLNIQEITNKFSENIDYVVGEKGSKLSGGEKQRISLARALIKDASVIILDEPTSSLDVRTEKNITESIKDILREKTVIIIAHRLSTIMEADRIVVLENGTIVEQGTIQELKQKNGYFSKYLKSKK